MATLWERLAALEAWREDTRRTPPGNTIDTRQPAKEQVKAYLERVYAAAAGKTHDKSEMNPLRSAINLVRARIDIYGE